MSSFLTCAALAHLPTLRGPLRKEAEIQREASPWCPTHHAAIWLRYRVGMSKPHHALTPLLLTLDEAAHVAGVSKSTWQRLVARGKAPKPRDPTGSSSRWLLKDIEAWAEGLPVANHLPPRNTGHSNRPHRRTPKVDE